MAIPPTTLKLFFAPTGECRRLALPGSFEVLQQVLAATWGASGEQGFVLTYRDEDGDTVAASTAAEYAEAVAVTACMHLTALKLTVHPGRESNERTLEPVAATAATTTETPAAVAPHAVHRNIVCDKSGMNPIVGPRFHVPGNDYDLCAAEFAKLPEAERLLFVEISRPGVQPVSCATGLPWGSPLRGHCSGGGMHRGMHRDGGQGCPSFARGQPGCGQGPRACNDPWRRCCRGPAGRPASGAREAPFAIELSLDELVLQASLFEGILKQKAAAAMGVSGSSPDGEQPAPEASPVASLLNAFIGPGPAHAVTSFAATMAASTAEARASSAVTAASAEAGTKAGADASATAAAALCAGKGCGKGGKGKGCKGRLTPLAHLLEAVLTGDAAAGGHGGGFKFGGGGGACATGDAVHHGVTCDKSGMNPIVGPRFHVPGNDYDLCAAEFAKLPEAERLLFVEISRPGAPHKPCFRLEGCPEKVPEDAEKDKAFEAKGGASSLAAAAEPAPKAAAAAGGGAAVEDEAEWVLPTPTETPTETPTVTPTADAAMAAAKEAASQEAGLMPVLEAGKAKRETDAKRETEASAKAKLEAAAAARTASLEEEYAEQLVALASLGLVDRDANVALLVRHNGRLERVINALLDTN